MDDALRHQLVAMAAEDARVRAELAATGELFRGYAPRMEDVHRRNARVERDRYIGNADIEVCAQPARLNAG